MNYRRLVPNSISSASLIFGILSIFKTIQGDFFYAPIFIVIAVILDSLDGRAARALGVGGGDFITVFERKFSGSRNEIRRATSNVALFYLIRYLKGDILRL